jgi:DNA adenine methylase
MATPVLKWAGGKRQLIPIIDELLSPDLKSGKIKKFAEPFFGGGAVFFHIVQSYQIEKAYISDLNIELVLLYKVIQQKVDLLIQELKIISDMFYSYADDEKRQKYFYDIRDAFNENVESVALDSISEFHATRAAQLIFLNKTCFNGLFRVNKRGKFNVPYSKPKNPTILDEKNLIEVSKLLINVVIEHADYKHIPKEFLDETFIYFDPPYRPLSQSSSFTSYSKYDFDDTHQIELSKYFKMLSTRTNLFLMLSNSDPKNANESDHFFDDLYDNFTIKRVSASRMINSNSAKRGKVSELIITNY